MLKSNLLLLFGILFISVIQAQIKGCTDVNATNYNSSATYNDGSCTYATTQVSMVNVIPKLSDTLHESSGLIFFENSFWTLNDGGNPAEFYQINSIGNISKTCVLKNGKNTDWEELTQDDTFFYIADFGNNGGNRKDLCFYKIRKNELRAQQKIDSVTFEKINFTLNDQLTFNNKNQEHNFDFEACFVYNNEIHLFSKNWLNYKTRHYVCPTNPGSYQLSVHDSWDCNGLITGACISKKGMIAFSGYDLKQNKTFVTLCWDYDSMKLSKGNRRQLYTGSTLQPGQTEAICFLNNQLYISNEKYINNAQLNRLAYQQFVNDTFLSQRKITSSKLPFKVVLQLDKITIDFYDEDTFPVEIYNSQMQCVLRKEKKSNRMEFKIENLNKGYYFLLYGRYSYGFILRD